MTEVLFLNRRPGLLDSRPLLLGPYDRLLALQILEVLEELLVLLAAPVEDVLSLGVEVWLLRLQRRLVRILRLLLDERRQRRSVLFGSWRKHRDRHLLVLRRLNVAVHEILHHGGSLLLLFRRRPLGVRTGCVVGADGRSSALGGGAVLPRLRHLVFVGAFLEEIVVKPQVLICVTLNELVGGPLRSETGGEQILVRGDVPRTWLCLPEEGSVVVVTHFTMRNCFGCRHLLSRSDLASFDAQRRLIRYLEAAYLWDTCMLRISGVRKGNLLHSSLDWGRLNVHFLCFKNRLIFFLHNKL